MPRRSPGIPVGNFINRVEAQVAAGKITPAQGQVLINDARETAGPDGRLSYGEREGLSSDLRVDKQYNAQFTTTPPTPTPAPTGGNGGGGGGGTVEPTPIRIRMPRVFAIPPAPPPLPPPPPTTREVKQASPDLIIFDEQIDADFITQSFFQEFGGTELINISRSDLIDGVDVTYSPIVNLSNLRQTFNPNNIISIAAFQENQTKYGIDLVSRGIIEPYFDDQGNLVVEIEEVRQDESIEVQIAVNGTINVIEL